MTRTTRSDFVSKFKTLNRKTALLISAIMASGLLHAAQRGSFDFDIRALQQQAYAKASNTDATHAFGTAVATAGGTVVVGAPLEGGDGVASSGAVYVFVRGLGGWMQQARLKASNANILDNFGGSVAIDGNTLVVGARNEDSNATGVNGNENDNSADDSGAVYVFVRDAAGNWSQQAYLKASNTEEDDWFGESVAISGDTIVAGARREDSNAVGVNNDENNNLAANSGAAYVFVRDIGGNWAQEAYLKASNTQELDVFGESVALSGDIVVVGARLEDSDSREVDGNQADNSAPSGGAAYVFLRDNGVWKQTSYLKPSNLESGDQFGGKVSVSGATIAVAALNEDSDATGVNGDQESNGAENSGAIYVFTTEDSENWTQQAYLKPSNTGAGDLFGSALATADGLIAAGASREDSAATGLNGNGDSDAVDDAGAAYVFLLDRGTWVQVHYIKASNTGSDDQFGQAVALADNLMIAGAPLEDSSAVGIGGDQDDDSAPGSGALYIFGQPVSIFTDRFEP